MQKMSAALTDAVKSDYQVPLAKIEIYNQDGTLATTIDQVISVNVDTAGSRKVLRQFSASINDPDGVYTPDPDQYDRNFLWYNKTAKIYFGYMTGINNDVPEYLPQGVFTIESIKPNIFPDGVVVDIEGRDLSSKLEDDKFDDTYVVEDTAATETVNYALATSGGSATATTTVSAGDEIQAQSRIHYVDTFATINGIPKAVINAENSSPTSMVNGKINKSLSFDGVDDYVEVNDSAVLSPLTAITLEFWFKWSGIRKTAASGLDWMTPFVKGTFNSGEFGVLINRIDTAANNLIRFYISNSISASYNAVLDSEYHHYAFTYDGAMAKIYLDGVNVASQSIVLALTDTTNNLRFGRNVSGVYPLDGSLDDARLWNVARSAVEIIRDMKMELIGNEPGLVGYWKFNEGSGTTALDATTNANHGTITGPVYSSQVPNDGWKYRYVPAAGETVSQIETEVFVDLQAAEPLQQINIVLEDGSTLTDFVYISADNKSWVSHNTATIVPAGPVRFIRFRARKQAANSDGSWSFRIVQIQLKTSDSFGPSKAIDGLVYTTHWRPGVTDPDPKITIAFGTSRTINVIYTYWGNDAFDFWNRVKYYLEYSTDGTNFKRINDLNGLNSHESLFGDVEHVFNSISCTHIRVSIKGRDGVAKLRHIKALTVTATQTVDKVIRDVLATTQVKDRVIGKNLLPPFNEWSLHANAFVTEPYKLTLTATAISSVSSVTVPCSPNVSYVLSMVTDGSFRIDQTKSDGTTSILRDYGTATAAVTTSSNAISLTVYVRNTSSAAGTFTFTNPQLELDDAATAHEPQKRSIMIPKTRRFIPRKMAEIGDEKEALCRTAAGSVGWVEPYMDEDGAYTTGPRDINPINVAWDYDPETDNIFSYSPTLSNDVHNVIVVVYKNSSGKSIVGRAQDDDPLSPTYIGDATNPGLGRRVFKYEGEEYNTQDKADAVASLKLFERTRYKHQTSLPVTGHPGIQVDDVIQVTVPDARIQNFYYLITGFVLSFDAENATFDTQINISQL